MRSIFAIVAALLICASQSFASFHLWKFDQAFSNADGSQQFLETDAGGGFGPAMFITETGAHTFTFPNDLPLPGVIGHDTSGQHVLIATTGFNPGGKIADFSIPAGFFNPSFDVVRYTPNDG